MTVNTQYSKHTNSLNTHTHAHTSTLIHLHTYTHILSHVYITKYKGAMVWEATVS